MGHPIAHGEGPRKGARARGREVVGLDVVVSVALAAMVAWWLWKNPPFGR